MIDILSNELRDIQSKTTGLYQCSVSGAIEVVINEDEHTFTTLSIGDLLGLSTCVFSKNSDHHRIVNFPGGKTLSEMMNDPLDFVSWFNKNIKQQK